MLNLDTLKAKKAEIMNKMTAAVKEGNAEDFTVAFNEMLENMQDAVLAEAKGLVQAADNTILAGRGARQLTSEETSYYQSVIQAMRSSNPRQALTDMTVVMPTTVIDAVFEDLVDEHPLLEMIDFVNTSGLVEYLVNTGSAELATWGALTGTIATELTRGFEKIDLAHTKLSAFVPVAKAMLDLGPAWLDRFVRAILTEAIANGLEAGIITGDGDDAPIGMDRDLEAPVVLGVYAQKSSEPITVINPKTWGAIAADLAVGPNDITRKITEMILIVNPTDYLNKVMPATTFQRQDGTYVSDVFPIKTTVIQSAHVTEGEAIVGLPKRYFMGIGTAKSGKIEYSDEYKFLEDERVYLVKLYGTGRPLDNTAFKLLDISGLTSIWDGEEASNP